MNPNYDLIVIGGGHNGLITAALVAKSGRKVLLLEMRSKLGGLTSSEEIYPGYLYNLGSDDASLLNSKVIKKLKIEDQGLEFIHPSVKSYSPMPQNEGLTIWNSPEKTVKEIQKFSLGDAEKYLRYNELINKLSGFLLSALQQSPPPLPKLKLKGNYSWIFTLLRAKKMGNKNLMALMRYLPMSSYEFLNEWFDDDLLKAALGFPGVAGSMQGPRASGTTFMMFYMQGASGDKFSNRFIKGGTIQLSNSLERVCAKMGVEIRANTRVDEIIVEDRKAVGIITETGEKIYSKKIASNLDPRRTLFDLSNPQNLDPKVIRKVRNIKFRGSTAKMLLALDELPTNDGVTDPKNQFSGKIIICPSLDYLERAYDNSKYGAISKNPALSITIPTILDESLAPKGKHIMSITIRYAPYHLKSGNWESARKELEENIINVLEIHFPQIKNNILHQHLITPYDYSSNFGLTEGSVYHGQMGLDQLLFMRPISGFSKYKTPIENLFICGSGAHPGGGVTGLPGYLAAKEILSSY